MNKKGHRQGFIGVLMLDTHFPRIPGDVGNPSTFEFPVRFRVISGATVETIVRCASPDDELVAQFIEAALEFQADGALGIVTSCGFLSVLNDELASAVRIPVITSALMLGPLVQSSIGCRRISVITANASVLSSAALEAAGFSPDDVVLGGMENKKEFSKAILCNAINQEVSMRRAIIENEVVEICKEVQFNHEDIGAFLFECTNLQPYAAAVSDATGLPVFGIIHAARILWDAAQPQIYFEE